MNEPLQRRAGVNIGIQPAWCPYVQSVNAPFIKLSNDDTVLWEGQKGVIRVPGGIQSGFPGALFSEIGGNIDVAVDLFFIDDKGNEFLVGDGSINLSDGTGPLFITNAGKIENGFFGLCPDEKIVARFSAVDSDEPPNGRVYALPYSKDYKVKNAKGLGGLTDGGAICVRGDITKEGLIIGPGPGETWELLTTVSEQINSGGGIMGLLVSNLDPVEPADIGIAYIAPDGAEFDLGIVAVLAAHTLSVVDGNSINFLNWVFKGFVQYPTKLRVYLDPASANTSRIQLLATAVRNDVSKSTAQEVSP